MNAKIRVAKAITRVMILACCCVGHERCFGQAALPLQPGVAAQTATQASEPAKELTLRQKMLAAEADKLVTMAAELKEQVDKTNKNILSMRVVLKAEEIEQFAHRVKQEKR